MQHVPNVYAPIVAAKYVLSSMKQPQFCLLCLSPSLILFLSPLRAASLGTNNELHADKTLFSERRACP